MLIAYRLRFLRPLSPALRMASETSLALPKPTPTRPCLSPMTSSALKLKRRPPFTTLAQRLIKTSFLDQLGLRLPGEYASQHTARDPRARTGCGPAAGDGPLGRGNWNRFLDMSSHSMIRIADRPRAQRPRAPSLCHDR